MWFVRCSRGAAVYGYGQNTCQFNEWGSEKMEPNVLKKRIYVATVGFMTNEMTDKCSM